MAEAKELEFNLDIAIIAGDIDKACEIAKELAAIIKKPKNTLGSTAIVCLIMSAERVIDGR